MWDWASVLKYIALVMQLLSLIFYVIVPAFQDMSNLIAVLFVVFYT
jgi:hypothetical protein